MFISVDPPQHSSTLFPYTTLFRSNECCADGDTHRTAHEGEVLDPEDDLVTIDFATGVDQRVALTCLGPSVRSEEHTSELQSPMYLVCRLLLEKQQANSQMAHTVRT